MRIFFRAKAGADKAFQRWDWKRNDTYEAALAALREDTQAWWADVLARDPDRLEGLARCEVHLDRKLERMLAMLLRLKDLRQGAIEG